MKVLFINTQKNRCGVHQYGIDFFNLLKESKILATDYAMCASLAEVAELQRLNSYDAILYNYHNGTTTSAFSPSLQKSLQAKNICILHDIHQLPESEGGFYDRVIMGDPGIGKISNRIEGYGRIIPEFSDVVGKGDILRVGSFGFNMGHKNYALIVQMVQAEYDEAEININIPPYNSTEEQTVDMVRNSHEVHSIFASRYKPGIVLNITHDFMDQDQVIKFLARNDLNVFPFGAVAPGSGISSSLDLAIASKKPFAVSSRCQLFRHVLDYGLPITIENNSIHDIILRGTKVLDPIYRDWSRSNTLGTIENLISK